MSVRIECSRTGCTHYVRGPNSVAALKAAIAAGWKMDPETVCTQHRAEEKASGAARKERRKRAKGTPPGQ